MKESMVWILLFIFDIATSAYTPVMITTLFRHGSRAPVTNNFNWAWVNNLGPGNLTDVGMRQHYILGMQLRENYPALFQNYTNFDYQLRSSPVPRTIQSAISQLTGIYQPGGDIDSGFAPNITAGYDFYTPNFDPLTYNITLNKSLPFGFGVHPVIPDSGYLDFMFRVDDACPNFGGLSDAGRKDLNKVYDPVAQPTYDALTALGYTPQQVGYSTWNLQAVDVVFDSLNAQRYYYGMNEPGMSDSFYSQFEIAMSMNSALEYASEEVQRLWTDQLSRNFIQGMDDRISGKTSLKLRMFSGHDSNLLPFMIRMNLMNQQCLRDLYETGTSQTTCTVHPRFASMFIWELVQDGNQNYFVRILYNGESVAFCSDEDNLPGNYCAYDTFKQRVNDQLYLTNFMEVCGNLYYKQSSLRSSLVVLIVGISTATFAAIVLMIQYAIGYFNYRKKLNAL